MHGGKRCFYLHKQWNLKRNFPAFSDSSRLAIMDVLRQGPLTVDQIVEVTRIFRVKYVKPPKLSEGLWTDGLSKPGKTYDISTQC